jgi:RNA polymerase sigma-70 factor (sigma-E family)
MDILQRARTRAEFEEFVASHVDRLLRAAFLMSRDRVEAEDLVQECLLRVARRWPRVRRMRHPGAYARRILVNLALADAPRRGRRAAEIVVAEDVAGAMAAACDFSSVNANMALIDALRRLPSQQRAIIVLRYFEDLSVAQVASVLGCSVGTVKSTASRGLVRLRNVLEEPVAEITRIEPGVNREGAIPDDQGI